MAPKPELQNTEIGELWRRYRPLEGRNRQADLILALIRKLIVQEARNIPYGTWRERLSHPLRNVWNLSNRMGFLRYEVTG